MISHNYLLLQLAVAVAVGSATLHGQTTEQSNAGHDLVIGSVQKAVNQIAREFEINDSLESQLVFGEVIGKMKSGAGSTISIVLFRPTACHIRLKTYEKRFDDRLVLRFTRVSTSKTGSPVAVVTIGTVVKGRTVLKEKIIRFENGKWHESSKRPH